MPELLAPAGNAEKLKAALYYGADAVYLAGKNFSLRAYADNFDDDTLALAIAYCHERGKKAYVALNVYIGDGEIAEVKAYAKYLSSIGCDAVIVSDIGVLDAVRNAAPSLPIHISTQANVTSAAAAKVYASLGAERIILSREMALEDIKRMRDGLDGKIALEAFVHGAMCVSYSGRCLLSDFMTGRGANKGECVQCCRYNYELVETSRGEAYPIEEDSRGSYILSSKDLCMLPHLLELEKAGVDSFKIEGRIKTVYYVACVVNAYRRAMDFFSGGGTVLPDDILKEVYKTSHREFFTGLYFREGNGQTYVTGSPVRGGDFCAVVRECGEHNGKVGITVEQRGRFKKGEVLEILSPAENHNAKLRIENMFDLDGNAIDDAYRVQQSIFIPTELKLHAGDILRRVSI